MVKSCIPVRFLGVSILEGSLPGQGRKHHSQVNYIESSGVIQRWLSRDVGKARSNLSIRIKSRWYSNADSVEWSGCQVW